MGLGTLISIVRTLRYYLAQLASRQSLSITVWIALGLTLEVIGREGRAQRFDIVSLFLITGLGLITLSAHRRLPLAWVDDVLDRAQRLWHRVETHKFSIGIDLRSSPPIEGSRLFRRLVPPLASVAALLLATGDLIPDLLSALTAYSYLIVFGVRLALWIAALLTTGILLIVAFAILHDVWLRRPRLEGHRLKNRILSSFGLLLAVSFGLSLAIPVTLTQTILFATIVISGIGCLPPLYNDVNLLWRRRDGRLVSQSLFITFAVTRMILAFWTSALLSALCGAEASSLDWFRPQHELSSLAGFVLSVAANGGFVLLAANLVFAVRQKLAFARHYPDRPVAYLTSEHKPSALKPIQKVFRENGWTLKAKPKEPEPTDIPLELDLQPVTKSEVDFDDVFETWPKRVTFDDFFSEELYLQLAQRRNILMRRRLVRAFSKLFKLARARKFRHGTGFWICPQYWFASGLTRDSEEEELLLFQEGIMDSTIGLPYREVLSWPVRVFFFEVAQATQIDIIFCEDGVKFPAFRKVLESILEHYAIHGRQLRMQEEHFQGLTEVKCIFHDFEIGNPFQSEDYPEPNYEDIGRARILHLFRDRGDSEEKLEVPSSDIFVPMIS